MACRYTYKGKTYEAFEFDDVLRAMQPTEAAKFMPSVSSIPSAPMVTDTKSWTALVMKRAIIEAVNTGAVKIAWTTGQQQVDRYSLEKQAGGVYYTKDGVGAGTLVVTAVGKTINDSAKPVLEKDNVKETDIEDYVGKEIAERLLKTIPDKDGFHLVEGEDLKVGGEGMKGFYDQIVHQVARDIVKKVGGQIEPISIEISRGKPTDYADFKTWKDTPETELKSQPGFTITPEMRAKVQAEGLPLFSNQRTTGLTSDYKHTQDQLDTFKRVGRTVDVPTLPEKIKEVTDGLGARLIQGIFDQFDPLKRLSTEAYRLMRQSKGASGAFEVLLQGGRLKLVDGTYDIDDAKMGGVLDKLLKPLQGQHDDFLWWVAANRAKYLKLSDRENLFTENDIKVMLTLADGQMAHDYVMRNGKVTRLRSEAFADSLITFNEFNKNVMDMAEQSGLIDKDSRKFWETEFYVPFYREVEGAEGAFRGMNIKGGAVRQKAFEKLKGGKSKLKSDLLENTLMNWAHLIDAAAKNRAAKSSLEAAEVAGVAHKAAPGEKQTVWFMGDVTKTIPMGQSYTENGVQNISDGTHEITYHGKVEYVVTDPMVMTAIQSLEYAGMNNPIMKAMSMFKHYMTIGVTASPFFKIRNLVRDSIQVVAIAPIGYNVAANLKQGWKLTDPSSLAYFHLMAGGGTIHFGTMLEGSESKRIRALTEMGIPRDTILDNEGAMTKMWKRHMEPILSAYNELGNRGEAINRATLYKQLTEQGMSHADASLLARDTMDFSMQGSYATVRFLTQLVPFMNARLQGMFKLGRSMKENPQRFSTVVGACAVLSMAMMLAYKDDEDWKKREDWDRDAYWWFKINGLAYRIPKPFEVGAMASVAERTLEYAVSDEMNGERLAKRFTSLLADNLAMNPMPQAFKPFTDVYANKDSFRDSPIETMGMDKLAPSFRYTSNTSMTARGLSTAGNAVTFDHFLSPVQIDHVIQGYFGWLGATTVATAEFVTNARSVMGEPARPSKDWIKTMSGGLIADTESAGSRYVSQIYEQSKKIEEAYATWAMLNKTGKVDEAEQWKDAHMDELRKYRMIEQVKHAESELNNQIKIIERSDMTADEKKESIKELRDQKHEIAKQIANITE